MNLHLGLTSRSRITKRVCLIRLQCCAQAYGAQAVVVSIDPRRVYVSDPSATQRPAVRTARLGPNGEQYCWWQCTVKASDCPVSRSPVSFLATYMAL